jgi:hypothetical protein
VRVVVAAVVTAGLVVRDAEELEGARVAAMVEHSGQTPSISSSNTWQNSQSKHAPVESQYSVVRHSLVELHRSPSAGSSRLGVDENIPSMDIDDGIVSLETQCAGQGPSMELRKMSQTRQ